MKTLFDLYNNSFSIINARFLGGMSYFIMVARSTIIYGLQREILVKIYKCLCVRLKSTELLYKIRVYNITSKARYACSHCLDMSIIRCLSMFHKRYYQKWYNYEIINKIRQPMNIIHSTHTVLLLNQKNILTSRSL